MKLLTVLPAKEGLMEGINGSFALLLSSFLIESIRHMIPWLVVMFSIIVCDLVAGIRKSLMLGKEVHFSGAVRRTMGKMVTYVAFVVTACFIDVASEQEYHIDKWACLTVCGLELISIFGNILTSKGYKLNLSKLAAALFGKAFGGEKSDYEDIIEESHEDNQRGDDNSGHRNYRHSPSE